jgi:hypothetical protein
LFGIGLLVLGPATVHKKSGLMWILKGTLLGLWFLGFGTIGWLWFEIYRFLPSGQGAVGADLIVLLTMRSPLWWTGLVLCFALGFLIVRAWRVPLGLWITLVVTGLLPAGFLTLFVVLYLKLKQMSHV